MPEPKTLDKWSSLNVPYLAQLRKWGLALLGAVGEPIRRGELVYRARPPIAGGEVELEARAIRQEWVVAAA